MRLVAPFFDALCGMSKRLDLDLDRNSKRLHTNILNGAGNAELACAIKKAGGGSVANAAIANHETEDGPERVVSAAARRLLGLVDVQRIISAAQKRGDVQGVIAGMRASLGSNGAQQLGCEAIALLGKKTHPLWPF